MSSEISVLIKGKNNEKASSSEFEILNGEEISDSLRNLLETNKKLQVLITEKFLEHSDRKGVVNSAVGASKKNNQHELWTPNYRGESYYGAVVGVIEDTIEIKLEDAPFRDVISDAWMSDEENELIVSIRLQIRSRFDEDKTYFLATMLLRDDIKLNDNVVLADEEDLYDYLLLIWYKKELLEAYEKGFYKTYRRFEANNDRVKGSIDIARHIKLNAGQSNGRIAYSYRENTVNNYLNHMIIAAYHHLKMKYPDLVDLNIENDADFKAIINGISSEIGYDPLESGDLIKNNNKPITHPYYMEYEDMRQVCIKILRDEGISIWNADNSQTKSILFYIPDLWELFLDDRLRKKIGDDVFPQGETPDGDKAVNVFGNKDAKKNSEFKKETHPDFSFFDMAGDQKPYMILDAKFRKDWKYSVTGNKLINLLDDYDKCIRDMNSMNSHATGVIFPVNQDGSVFTDEGCYGDLETEHRISQYNQNDIFYTFPVIVPGEHKDDRELTYSEWRRLFDRFVDNAIDFIKAEVEKQRNKYRNTP